MQIDATFTTGLVFERVSLNVYFAMGMGTFDIFLLTDTGIQSCNCTLCIFCDQMEKKNDNK